MFGAPDETVEWEIDVKTLFELDGGEKHLA